MKIKKAVIPAAGLGTRFLPATKAQPKEMLPIVDTPSIQYIVEEAVKSGIEDIVIITGRTKKSIEDHFDRSIELELELERTQKEELLRQVRDISSLANIYYIRQQEALGLGHAISCARTFIGNEAFAVLLGDDIVNASTPVLKQLMNVYDKTHSSVIGVQAVPQEDVPKYGIVSPELPLKGELCRVLDLVEKPAKDESPSNIAIMGRYILTPEIFSALKSVKPGKGGEIQLTDALQILLRTEDIYAYEFEGTRYDVGDKLGYLSANVEYALMYHDFSSSFADVLARIALDPSLPVHKAIAKRLKENKERQ